MYVPFYLHHETKKPKTYCGIYSEKKLFLILPSFLRVKQIMASGKKQNGASEKILSLDSSTPALT